MAFHTQHSLFLCGSCLPLVFTWVVALETLVLYITLERIYYSETPRRRTTWSHIFLSIIVGCPLCTQIFVCYVEVSIKWGSTLVMGESIFTLSVVCCAPHAKV